MSKEHKLTPELRFPEFVNDREWVERTLIDTADKKVKWSFTGGPFGSNLMASDYTSSGIRIIQLQNIGDGVFNDDNKIYSSIEKADELLSCNIYAGDIIISKMGDPVGRACIIPDNLQRCIMASDGIRLAVDESKYSKYFIYSLINSKLIREVIERKSTGSTRKRIGLDTLREVELIVPKSLKEQQKIASCLSSLDEVITAHSQKLDLLKDHKKGLMQNLFPQEGETVPKVRFKEFERNGDWELPKLEDKMDIFRGASPRPQGDPKYYGGKVPRLMIEDVTRDGKYSTPKIDSLTEEGATKSRFLKKGSVVLSCSGTRVAIPGILAVDACIHDGWLGFKNLKEIDTEFLYYHFCNLHEKIQGDALAGGVFNNLTTTILKETKLGFPRLKEQQKIALCLSSLDALIIAQTEQIAILKLHKKGLMQGLFPKIND